MNERKVVKQAISQTHHWSWKLIKQYVLYVALIQALVATLASLYASEIAHIPACNLCWYQRILMYPLVLILSIGIARRDKNVTYYVLPMSILGMVFASYNYLLQLRLIPETIAPCTNAVPCADIYGLWFGFITIPLLSLVAFAIITSCMILYTKYDE